MSNEKVFNEVAHAINGVQGRMFNRIQDTATGLYRNQTWAASRPFKEPGYREGSTITVEIRFDDQCKNGAMSFAITGHVQEPRARDWSIGGCIHEEIKKYFPELAHLIKWHHMDTDAPMHYTANTIYHASNLANGYAAGEPCAWETKVKFGEFPISFKLGSKFRAWLAENILTGTYWEPMAVEHEKKPGDTYDFAPKYTLNGFYCKWHECPFDTLSEVQEFIECLNRYPMTEVKIVTAYSKGKERNLEYARSSAIWPEATDAELCAPADELKAALLARLPALVAAFRADMDACGFAWADSVADRRGENNKAG